MRCSSNDLVAPAMLCSIEILVSYLDQAFLIIAGITEICDANTDGYLLFEFPGFIEIGQKTVGLDTLAQTLCQAFRGRGRCIGGYDEKLFTAVSRQDI